MESLLSVASQHGAGQLDCLAFIAKGLSVTPLLCHACESVFLHWLADTELAGLSSAWPTFVVVLHDTA